MRCLVCDAPTLRRRWLCPRGHGWSSMPRQVIGICGKAHSGKTTVATELSLRFSCAGKKVLLLAFSDVVLEAAYEAGIFHRTYTRDKLSAGQLQRLVEFGAEGRAQDEDYWLQRLARRAFDASPDVLIVHGVRFPNEVELVEAAGGVTVKVTRPGHVASDRDKDHPMETSLDGFLGDFRVRNDHDLRWLRCQAGAIFDYLTEVKHGQDAGVADAALAGGGR